jgi:hypothetical protein
MELGDGGLAMSATHILARKASAINEASRSPLRLPCIGYGNAPDFVEVGEAGIAVDHAMRRQRRVQLVG